MLSGVGLDDSRTRGAAWQDVDTYHCQSPAMSHLPLVAGACVLGVVAVGGGALAGPPRSDLRPRVADSVAHMGSYVPPCLDTSGDCPSGVVSESLTGKVRKASIARLVTLSFENTSGGGVLIPGLDVSAKTGPIETLVAPDASEDQLRRILAIPGAQVTRGTVRAESTVHQASEGVTRANTDWLLPIPWPATKTAPRATYSIVSTTDRKVTFNTRH